MELLYHVNEKDEVLGHIDRDQAHSQQLLHRTGIVFLMNTENKVLITIRSPEKTTFSSRHDASVSFHVTYGETYEAAARREMLEEIGIRSHLLYLGKFLHHDPPEYQIVAVFLSISDDPPIIDSTEFSGYYSYSLTEINHIIRNEKITPWLRDGWAFLKNHLMEMK